MNNILLTFYGDDFTGSTDSMEALTSNGFRTMLFLKVPSPQLIADRFPDLQCIGIAGISRSLSPLEMEREFLPILGLMKDLQAPVIHYKVCSTFDSSPELGSIGKVIDMAKEVFPFQPAIPVLVAAPALGRYTLFGNHFAAWRGVTHRLDRHPTMSKHPSTPMHEADLRLHLNEQTASEITLFDVLDLNGDFNRVQDKYQAKLNSAAEVILFDTLHDQHLATAGHLLWNQSGEDGQFVIGSSGVQYALSAHWKKSGIDHSFVPTGAGPARQLLVVSGSCSPVTNVQIETALEYGFMGIRVQVEGLLDPSTQAEERRQLFDQASSALKEGKSVLIYSAAGPEDEAISSTKQFLQSLGKSSYDMGNMLGEQLGRLTRELISAVQLKRVVVAGGDTSGYVTKELGIYGLEVIKPIAPGAPLCRCYSEEEEFDGLELALKSGQFGQEDFFIRILQGN